MRRRLIAGLGAAALLVVASLVVMQGSLHQRALPTIDGYYRMLGLDARAEVLRDAFGVPRIQARTAHDLFFLQGYVTAQDRLAQMEAMRRAALGALHDEAGTAAERADGEVRAVLDAYAEGVTKFIDQHAAAGALPAELVMAGRPPAPWTPADSLAIVAAYLEPETAPAVCVAVSGERTFRGCPLLAAELQAELPSPGWYEIGLADGEMRAVGISLPGVPGIVAGHNGLLAWALNASGRTSDPPRAVGALIAMADAGGVADVRVRDLQNGSLAGCLADVRGATGGLTPFAVLDETVLAAGERSRQEDVLADLSAARDLDVEALRILLGRPAASEAAARILIDLGDPDASKAALSTGQSAHRLSSHFRDQVPLWEAGQLHQLAWSRSAIARTEGQLVLRAR